MRQKILATFLLFVSASPILAQAVDFGQSAHEQVRRAQSQGLVQAPPVTIISPTPAQPRLDQGAVYHRQVVKEQHNGYRPPKVKKTTTKTQP